MNPYTYRGYRYDTEVGYYYLNSRYYNPGIGRFINADGMLGDIGDILSTNIYAYCANNPVMYSDSSGQFAVSIILAFLIGGAILGGVTGGINAYNNGARGWELVAGIALGTLTGAVIGTGVGVVAGLGGAYLAQGLISISGKFVEDLFAYSMFGTSIGTWEDYALAFIGGGLTANMGLVGKFAVDVIGRPFANQISKMGTGRQSELQWDKLGYDIATRAITFGIPKPWRSFARGITRGGWNAYIRGPVGNNQWI